jgi:hypothetical protein
MRHTKNLRRPLGSITIGHPGILSCGSGHDGGNHSAVAQFEPVAGLGDKFEERCFEKGEAGLVGGNVNCQDVADGHGAGSGAVLVDLGRQRFRTMQR